MTTSLENVPLPESLNGVLLTFGTVYEVYFPDGRRECWKCGVDGKPYCASVVESSPEAIEEYKKICAHRKKLQKD
jgi:hypothetical protein